MLIKAVVDFFHGSNADGSSRKFEAGKTYDLGALDAGMVMGAGWAIRADGDGHAPAQTAASRVSAEPVEVTFHPPADKPA